MRAHFAPSRNRRSEIEALPVGALIFQEQKRVPADPARFRHGRGRPNEGMVPRLDHHILAALHMQGVVHEHAGDRGGRTLLGAHARPEKGSGLSLRRDGKRSGANSRHERGGRARISPQLAGDFDQQRSGIVVRGSESDWPHSAGESLPRAAPARGPSRHVAHATAASKIGEVPSQRAGYSL